MVKQAFPAAPSPTSPDLTIDIEKGQMYAVINSRNGKTLREKRLEKGLTQKELSTMVGCSKPMISQVETGRIRAGFDLAVKIYIALEYA